MGFGDYFKASSKAEPTPSPEQSNPPSRLQHRNQPSAMSEKHPSSTKSGNDMELQAPTPRFHSRPQSSSGRSSRSTPSVQSSVFLDDIKHEVMVNYLYQQQCSQLWVSDGSGEVEGVLLRKARGHYMACPPQLGNSPFAMACAALNVQVSSILQAHIYPPIGDEAKLIRQSVCHDGQFPCH